MARTGRPRKSLTKAKAISINLRVELELKQKFEEFAEEDHVDLSDIARKALREYIQRREAA